MLSTAGDDESENRLFAPAAGGYDLVRGKFRLASDVGYDLDIVQKNIAVNACGDSAAAGGTIVPTMLFRWLVDDQELADASVITTGDAFFSEPGHVYTLVVDIDNAAHCKSIDAIFFVTGSKRSPSGSGGDDGGGDSTGGEVNPPSASTLLTAGVAVIGSLSADEACQTSLVKHFGDLLFEPGVLGSSDTIEYLLDETAQQLSVKTYHAGLLLGRLEIDADLATLKTLDASFKSGRVVPVTEYEACADTSAADTAQHIRSLSFSNDVEAAGQSLQEIDLARTEEHPHGMEVTYAYSADFNWSIDYATRLSDATIATLPDEIHWAIYNKRSFAFIMDWQPTSRESLKAGSFTISDPAILKRLLPNQTDLEIIFDCEPSSRAVKERFVLALGYYCRDPNSPYFSDLTNPDKHCYEVRSEDLPR